MDDITSKSLREFYKEQEAPPGFVYFIAGEAAMQIHFFEEFFTLFWLGPTSLPMFIETFSHIVRDVRFGSPFLGVPTPDPLVFEGSVFVVVDQLQSTEGHPDRERRRPRYWKAVEKIRGVDTESFDSLKKRLDGFVESFRWNKVAIQTEVKTKFNKRDYLVSLWTDTPQSEKKNKETGLTSNLPLTNSLTELVEKTCPAARKMAPADFNDFMTEIRSKIADRRYY